MRTLVIADIHGCLRALETLLNCLTPTSADMVILLGDYIDRGPASAQVIDTLIALRARTRLIAIMGNHEEMLLNARSNNAQYCDWLLSGGDATLLSYKGRADSFREIPAAHWAFLESLLPYYETGTHLFTHATPDPRLPLVSMPKHFLRWNRFEHAKPHVSGKPFVCGHTPQKSGLPCNLGFAVALDTHPCGKSGALSCLHVETGEIAQATEMGQLRRMHLSECPMGL